MKPFNAIATKTTLASAVLLGLSFAPALACPGEGHEHGMPPKYGTISTSGHGEVKLKPDSLSLTLTVTSQQPDMNVARDENNKKAQAVINALKGLNVAGLKLETSNIRIYPVHEQRDRSDKLPKVIGYNVTNTLEARLVGASPEKLGETGGRILDAAMGAGANQAGGLNFYVNDMSPARSQALELAVKDARHNAEAMARAGGVTLGGVMTMDGSPQFGGYPVRPMAMRAYKTSSLSAAEVADTPMETGDITVTSDVSAKFKF